MGKGKEYGHRLLRGTHTAKGHMLNLPHVLQRTFAADRSLKWPKVCGSVAYAW